MIRFPSFLSGAVTLLGLLLTDAGEARVLLAEAPDAAFLEGLRQRKWFDLAEEHCRTRLSQAEPGTPAEAAVTAELIRTYWMHAIQAPLAERDRLWNLARSAAEDFRQRSPRHPREVAVRLEFARALVARGQLDRLETEVRALPAERVAKAHQSLREAADLLQALDQELQRELPLRRRRPPRAGEFTVDELVDLASHTQHQLARAQRSRALLFPTGSDDRLALLVAASETLKQLLSGLRPNQPLVAIAQLDLAECQRLLARFDEAQALAAGVDREGESPVSRLRARTELMQIAIARNDWMALKELTEASRTLAGRSSAELDFARFEAFLVLSRNASSREQAQQFQQQVAGAVALLQDEHGAYWSDRADARLAGRPAGEGPIANVDLLVRAAAAHFLNGQFDQAIAAYDEAAIQAHATKKSDTAFELAYKAALVEQHRGGHDAAATRLRDLARSDSLHPDAAAAHLLAIWNAARLLGRDENADAKSDGSRYEDLLAEHLAAWPTAESAEQVRLWLGARLRQKGEVENAIDILSALPRETAHAPAAASELARAWNEQLAALAAAGKPTGGEASAAIRALRRFILDANNRWPESWNEAARSAAMAAAELIVEYQPGSASDAEDLLRRAIDHSPGAPPEWQAAAQAQLVLALAAQGGRQQDAVSTLREMGKVSPSQMLAVVQALVRIAARGSESSRARIAGVVLAAVESLAPVRDDFDEEQRLALDRVAAEALLAAGRRKAAVEAYSSLARSNPDSGEVQMAYAKLLLDSDEPAELEQALIQWRLVARRSPPRSERWLRSKHSIALAQLSLGNRQDAAMLARFLLETPPGLKGTKWEEPFQELLKKCAE